MLFMDCGDSFIYLGTDFVCFFNQRRTARGKKIANTKKKKKKKEEKRVIVRLF